MLFRSVAREVHARGVWQVMVGYGVTAWLIFQVVMALYDALGLPRWVPPLAIVLLLIGLPIVVLTAFVQRGAPSPADLLGGGTDPTLHPEFESITPLERKLTWRRSLMAGAAAFMVLGLSTVGFMTVRNFGSLVAQGILAENDRIVLADFRNERDPKLGAVVAEALRIDLQQSDVIRLAEPNQIEAELRRMQRTDGALDEKTARELAQRAGLKAVLAGDIAQLGAGYTINARLLTADGAVAAAFRETARDSTELIEAVGRLSEKLRSKIGESLKSIRADPPLQQATTSSLAALRLYTEAMAEDANLEKSVRLLEDAIALDSTFAMAYRRLTAMLFNMRAHRTRQMQTALKAYELRDRLPEDEKYHTIAMYEFFVNGDLEASIAAYQRVLAEDSLDFIALNNTVLRLNVLGRYKEAEVYAQRAVRLPASPASIYVNYVALLYQQGRYEEAERLLQEALRRFPAHPTLRVQSVFIPQLFDRWARADSAGRAAAPAVTSAAGQRALTLACARTYSLRGQLAEADRMNEKAIQAMLRDSLYPEYLTAMARRAVVAGLVEGRRDQGIALLNDALGRVPLERIDAYGRPHNALAAAFIRLGEPARGEALLRQFESAVPTQWRGPFESEYKLARGLLFLNRGSAAEAIRQLRESAEADPCKTCTMPDIAAAFDALAQPDSAAAQREVFLQRRDGYSNDVNVYQLPAVLLSLAEYYETRQPRKAIELYTRFIERWQPADAHLQPRVRAAEARRAELLRKIG